MEDGRFRIPLTSLTLPHICACPKPGPGFPKSYVVVSFFMFNELKREVIVHFDDTVKLSKLKPE